MTVDVQDHPDLTLLKNQLLSVLEDGSRSLEDLKTYALLETVFKGTHAVEAVAQLEADGTVVRRAAKKHSGVEVSLPPKSLFDR